MSPHSRMFRGSNKAQMGSNIMTVQNQGGGSKKAGFPYMIGRTNNTDNAFSQRTGLYNLTFMRKNAFNANTTRPISSSYSPNTYWHMPGTKG
jgi:hypothetical protein